MLGSRRPPVQAAIERNAPGSEPRGAPALQTAVTLQKGPQMEKSVQRKQ